MLCFNMLYKIAHFLRDQMPWLWDLVDTVNSMVFRIKYGNKLETIENDICRRGDYSGELMREQGHRQSVGIVHNEEHRERREPDNNERIAEQGHIFELRAECAYKLRALCFVFYL